MEEDLRKLDEVFEMGFCSEEDYVERRNEIYVKYGKPPPVGDVDDEKARLEQEKRRLEEEEEAKAKRLLELAIEQRQRELEEEAKLRAEEEAKLRAEEEAKMRAEEEAKMRAEMERLVKKAEEEERLRRMEEEQELRLIQEEERQRRIAEEEERRARHDAEKPLDADVGLPPELARLLSQLSTDGSASVTFSSPDDVPYGVLCNSSPHELTFDGVKYACAAQAIHSKAVERGMPETGHERLTLVFQVLEAKFSEHPFCKKILLHTKTKTIRYQSPDEYWGDGGGEGENMLGNILMALRAKMIGAMVGV